jgi:fatty-acyl-CoA synthase
VDGVEEGSDQTLGALLARWAADAPTDLVAVELQGHRRRLTIGELAAGADRRAAGLAALGAGPGRAVVAWLPNRLEWLELVAAAGRIGAPVVGLNTRYRSDELRHVLDRSDAAVLVAVDDVAGVRFADVAAAADLGADRAVVVVDGVDPNWARTGARILRWEELPAGLAVEHRPAATDLLIAFTTSGTTGLPKVAVHDHAGTVRHAERDAEAFDVRPGDRLLLDLPICGTFGFSALMASIAGRATTLIHERFVPAASAHAIAGEGVTHYHASDDMILRVLDTGLVVAGGHEWRQGGVANFVNAGEAVVERVERDLGVRLTGVYGMSEVFALLARWPPDWPARTRHRPGGIPVDGALEVRVVDPESGVPLDVGADGELCFRGPQVLRCYLGDPAATAKALAADGWFRSGDLGRRTPEGGFEYLARLGDSLRLRGFLVDPAEIERRLELHPAVELAQVVGAERAGRGQVAVAFVKLRGGAHADEAGLRAHCAAGIADLKVPERVIVVDEFPSVDGPNGRKIRKADLRARAAGLLDG